MFRSVILSLALAGCSDYSLQIVDGDELDAQETIEDPAPDATPEWDEPQDEDPDEDVEDSTPDEEPEGEYPPDPDCGFTVENWFLLPEGGGPQTSFVKSYPMIELVGFQPGIDEYIQPGDPLTLSVIVTAHPCGDVELVRVDTTIQEETLTWLLQVTTQPAQMNATDGWQFESVPATGVGVSPGSDELHFVWTDGSTYPLDMDNAGEMDTVLIPAGGSVTMTFTFTATQGATPGTVVDLFLDGINWVDVETAQIVRFWGPGKIVEFE